MAYRFSGRFSGRIFRLDKRMQLQRKENRMRRQRGVSRLAIAQRRIRALETEIQRLEGLEQLALPAPEGG